MKAPFRIDGDSLPGRVWSAIVLVGIFLAWAAYGLWCLITGTPMQPMN